MASFEPARRRGFGLFSFSGVGLLSSGALAAGDLAAGAAALGGADAFGASAAGFGFAASAAGFLSCLSCAAGALTTLTGALASGVTSRFMAGPLIGAAGLLKMHSRCFYALILALAETEPEIDITYASVLQDASGFRTVFARKYFKKLQKRHADDGGTGRPNSTTQTTSPPSARLQSNPSISPSFTLGTSFLM